MTEFIGISSCWSNRAVRCGKGQQARALVFSTLWSTHVPATCALSAKRAQNEYTGVIVRMGSAAKRFYCSTRTWCTCAAYEAVCALAERCENRGGHENMNYVDRNYQSCYANSSRPPPSYSYLYECEILEAVILVLQVDLKSEKNRSTKRAREQ